MEFRDRLLETYSPAVMVVSSPEAEAMVQEKNGLTIVDLLRPFGYFHHLSGKSGCLWAEGAQHSFHSRPFCKA